MPSLRYMQEIGQPNKMHETPTQIIYLRPSTQITYIRPSTKKIDMRPSTQITYIRPSTKTISIRPSTQITYISPCTQITYIRPSTKITDMRPYAQITAKLGGDIPGKAGLLQKATDPAWQSQRREQEKQALASYIQDIRFPLIGT